MNSLDATVTESLSAIQGINAEIARLAEEAKAARKKAIEPFLESLAKSGEVSIIVVRGYTPGFNDGEPCEHSADFFVNVKSVWGDDSVGVDLPSDLIDGLEPEGKWVKDEGYKTDEAILANNIALCQKHGHVYLEPSAEIMKAISNVIFDTAEEENETNYYVTYLLKDGKFEVHSGHYDCGY